ncbi:Hsp20/alpha crystallin family protein [Streptomyces sp. RPT161]|uniref:Hsp20/alpha crystallin family protein n=1 Tax=Streptomyces sp. RPT161 TaxID=3015993 RepID=UPI002FCE788F
MGLSEPLAAEPDELFDGRELPITGEHKEREREGVLRRSTRRTGRFEYRALLPADAKAEEIEATLSEGWLTVTIPKAQAAKPRHIEISQPGKAGT